jgi:hypothetical protein
MVITQENKVFLKRGNELLLFKKNDAYDGDDVNIERYLLNKFLRYIAVKKVEGGIKLIYFYFANTSDQYITQFGEWIPVEELMKKPLRPATSAVLDNFLSEGQYDKEIRVGTKNGKDVVFTILTE